MKFLPLIWSSLNRRRLRTGLTAICIVFAFILFGYLSAISRALNQGVTLAGADRLMIRHRVSITQPLPSSYQRRIATVPGVEAVVHASWFGGIYREPRNFFAQMAVLPEAHLAMYPEFLLPEDQREAWFRNRASAIVGRKTAERFGWKVGDRIPLQATVWTRADGNPVWEFELLGIYDGAEQGTDVTNFFFHFDYLDEARAFGRGLVGWYLVRVTHPEQADRVASSIDELFANSSAETKTETEGAFLRGWARQIGDITMIMAAILSAVFFTILLVAGNTMAQSVRERAEELGVLKALGFTHGRVLLLVLAESCLLALLGGGVGLAIAYALIAQGDPTGGTMPMFYFPHTAVARGIGYTLMLGLAAGWLPAWQAGRLRIADALRRQ